jgi:hypothetical protein
VGIALKDRFHSSNWFFWGLISSGYSANCLSRGTCGVVCEEMGFSGHYGVDLYMLILGNRLYYY